MVTPRLPRGIGLLGLWACTTLALAGGTPRPDGWTDGIVAKGTARVLSGPAERIALDLPVELRDRIQGPTFLVYFSPTCPHCRDAQPELNALARRVAGRAAFLGIASGSATPDQVEAFRRTYNLPYPLLHDQDRTIAAAIGARSTPSVLLVDLEGRRPTAAKAKSGGTVVKEAWYPYRRGSATLLEMRVSESAFAPFTPGRYHSNATCGACHVEELASWGLTHHSLAWETLMAKGAEERDDCTGCHVTGRDQGGWRPGEEAWVDVGCEACHGPGGPHDGTPTRPSDTCSGCHDKKHSIAFSVEKGLPHLDHFRSAGLTAAAYADQYRAVHTGPKERPLLAFEQGPHVGSAACASCHPAEYAWWRQNDHAKAMSSLASPATASADPECVRCHASPKMHGIPPSSAAGNYLVDEGIGCESCHGPGGRHVAAQGGTDNIEGLGEDCPVCVIEALCTSCHTARWDPTWNLETRLGQVGHGSR